MSSYSSVGLPRTNGTNFLIASIFGAALLVQPQPTAAQNADKQKKSHEATIISLISTNPSNSYRQAYAHFAGDSPIKVEAFDVAVIEFYDKLLSEQTSLGPQFEKVLHDNLWNLYVD